MKPALIATVALAIVICLIPRGESKQRAADVAEAAQDQNPRTVTPLVTSQQGAPNDQTSKNQPPSGDSPTQWILIIVTAITAAFICWQAWETRRTAKAAADSVNAINAQADIMERQTKATETAAEAALLNAKAIISSERAWILAKPDLPEKLTPAPKNTLTRFKWSMKNVGRTPARIIETDAVAWRVADMKTIPKQPKYEGDKAFSMNKFLLVPGDSIPIYWMIEPAGDPLTIEQVENIKDLKLTLFAYGFVRYFDIFGETHTTRFCHRYVFREWEDQGFEPYVDAPPSYSECD